MQNDIFVAKQKIPITSNRCKEITYDLFNFKYSKEYFAEIVEESELQPYNIWLFPARVMRESPPPTKNLLISPSPLTWKNPPGRLSSYQIFIPPPTDERLISFPNKKQFSSYNPIKLYPSPVPFLHFCFNFIRFGHTGHDNCNWCLIFTESCFYLRKRFKWSEPFLISFSHHAVKKSLPPAKFPIPSTGGEFSPPLTASCGTLGVVSNALHGIIELYVKIRSFLTAEDYVQRQCCLKKGTKKKASKTELKKKMTIFTRKTMNYRERGKADYIEFSLSHLIAREFR